MKIPSLKTLINCSIIVFVISFVLQAFLLFRVYQAEHREFDIHVSKSLNSLFKQSLLSKHDSRLMSMPHGSNGYLCLFDSLLQEDKLVDVFVQEVSDFGIFCNFEFYIYRGRTHSYETLLQANEGDEGSQKTKLQSTTLLPVTSKQHLYIRFPGKNWFLIQQLIPWILSYLFFILCLAAIAFFLYHFYKNRFWNGVQKDFINNLIHEFRTPVSVISIGSKVLQSNGIENDGKRMKKYARVIKEQTDLLQDKISRILELSLSGKKTTYLNKEFVDVNTLVVNALAFIEPMIHEKKASVEFIPAANLGRVNGDAVYLTQAVVNLLDNSLKYANFPHIKLETTISDRNCSISITDNGIGMEKKYFKHIFRKYYRIPTGDVHNVKGFGIGLNFVKNVIDAHNGQIEVSSTPGKGTEFRIKLPLT